jgi:hypothetical protein
MRGKKTCSRTGEAIMATTKSSAKKSGGSAKKSAGGVKKSGSKTKYGKKSGEKVERAMHERKTGTLRSGSGKKVTSRKQAVAIGLSEARKEGAKVPKKKSSKS